ncbi:DNA polymerase subunit Cdc27 [Emericellopsis atlantica]|uniref:DNA polymerase delta subunit 3 n=1 Tax=Emericellopsis atlantica TaxID=2614577 RepID=A0A9P7ZHZ8_9HYPO|nr:DNA polymerase subunit Cdc27 [Emericellopsis atlantica]KAG9251838.1 DNA polymerase subunit Cdc27 [Emericellopsis atlantica]
MLQITYRLLSRALNVHVNTAKEMLYEYHKYQNAQKANSIHATYLVYGVKNREASQEDGDVDMASSMPDQDETPDVVHTNTLTLVREEDLTETLAAYESVSSLYVYSLAPHPQRDLAMLSDIAKSLAEYTIKEQDVSVAAKKFGTILNPHARRRDRAARPKVAASAQAKPPKPAPSATKAPAAPVEDKVKAEPKPTGKLKREGSAPSSKESTPAPGPKPAALKRGGSGGIMQSFAKAASQPKKPQVQPKEEEHTALSDDGEADDDDIAAEKPLKESASARTSRKEREERLRQMMEEDDDDDAADAEKDEHEDGNADDEEMEDAPAPEAEAAEEPKNGEPSEVVSSTGDGRRRGKRKVMKKKRILDDQGYMVTIQEPGWESFSEDEAPAPAKKAKPAPTPTSSAPAKSKKPTGKGGAQGSLMSFFSKK